jgi:hypothetical protein
MPRNAREFWLVVVDDEQKTFTIEGPMIDDTRWNEAVCTAQEGGRSVRCYSAPIQSSRESVRGHLMASGYTEAVRSIVTPSMF